MARGSGPTPTTLTSHVAADEILDIIGDACVVLDHDWRIIYLNAAARELFGHGCAERLGTPLWDEATLSSDDLPFVEFRRAMEQRVPVAVEFYSPTGARWLEARAFPCDAGLVVLARDVTEREQAHDQLRKAEAKYQALIERMPAVVYVNACDEAASGLYMSPHVSTLLGYDPAAWLADPTFWATHIHPEDREPVLAGWDMAVRTGDPFVADYRMIAADGREVWIQDEAIIIVDEHGQPSYWQGIWLDVTQRRQQHEELRRKDGLYRTLAHNFPNGYVVLFDRDLRAQVAEGTALADFGLSRPLVEGRTIWEVLPDSASQQIVPHLRMALDGTPSAFELLTAAHTYLVHTLPVRDDAGTIHGVLTVGQDITERKQLEETLSRQAFFDALTGLPNRTLLRSRTQQALTHAHRRQAQVAVVLIDIDNFNVINDSLGRAAGDRLLVQLAARLSGCVRDEDTVARLGEDEFALLLTDVPDQAATLAVVQRVQQVVMSPFRVSGRDVFVTTSLGIAMSQSPTEPADDLLHRADAAMYQAKASGKNRCVVFDAAMHAATRARLDLDLDLRRAMQRQEFTVYYQPKVLLATGEIMGVEALVRWQHPQRGLVPPSEFIPFAEETGLIVPLGRWVVREACRQVRAWNLRRVARAPLLVSVNLSARQFQHPDLLDDVSLALAESDLAPSCLALEITESAMIGDADEALRKLRALKALGVLIGIDDFGTGYSSLAYLKRFPVDVLKIDRSFVGGLGADPDDTAIVAATINLGHALGLRVVGEGVETAAQLMQLRNLGCDVAQGYYFARPQAAEAVGELLNLSSPI
jgi:diguanylate cyclase (GGDEF)-like protein/PAS domain S-box-containing protein